MTMEENIGQFLFCLSLGITYGSAAHIMIECTLPWVGEYCDYAQNMALEASSGILYE